jgi:nicotinate-nucleotide pyrophosphorylase
MTSYTFEMTRTETGEVTVEAESLHEATKKAIDYTSRIILVDNMPWYKLRKIDQS